VEGITKGWTIALAVTVITLVLAFVLYGSQLPETNNGIMQSSSSSAAPANKLRDVLLVANEKVLMIAPDNDLHPGGIWYNAMTFNDTIPGPVIFANQGETLRITLKNEGKFVHSLNFHAGFGPSQALSGIVNSGQNKTWTMKVDYPGAFLYHCDGDNLNGIWEHIADGMYGGMVVHSQNENNSTKEFYVAFSEVYDTNAHAPFATANQSSSTNSDAPIEAGSFDMDKFIARNPDLVLTNGMAFRYIPWIGTDAKILLNSNAEVFHVKTGELTRWYLFNAGPRNSIAFNFGSGLLKGAIIDNGDGVIGSAPLPNGQEDNKQRYDEIVNIPPGSGTVIEATFPEPGTYFGNDHDVGSILYGAGFVVIAE
jgi:nitrite reductase (NO-forming)